MTLEEYLIECNKTCKKKKKRKVLKDNYETLSIKQKKKLKKLFEQNLSNRFLAGATAGGLLSGLLTYDLQGGFDLNHAAERLRDLKREVSVGLGDEETLTELQNRITQEKTRRFRNLVRAIAVGSLLGGLSSAVSRRLYSTSRGALLGMGGGAGTYLLTPFITGDITQQSLADLSRFYRRIRTGALAGGLLGAAGGFTFGH